MNDRKGNEYHSINSSIDKQLSSQLKVQIYFFAMSKGQAKLSWWFHNAKFTLSTANFRTVRVFPLQVLASWGAIHLTKISGNSGTKSNGTERFWKFVSKIVDNLRMLS